MKRIRIFQHLDCEGPAYLQTLLQAKRIPIELVRIDANDPVIAELDNLAGLIFMGGPMSVNDPLPWIDQELALIRQALAQDIPCLGVCLGSQLIAKALGARVYPGPCMEIGWYPVSTRTSHSLLEGLPETFEAFHWHGETFDLPPDAVLLFGNDSYARQGFAIGPHLGLQFHVEMEAELVREWVSRNPGDLERRCEQDHDASVILHDLDAHIATLHRVAEPLFNNWLRNCRFD